MRDIEFLNILNTVDELVEKLSGFILLDAFVFDNIIEKFSILHVFHDEH